MGVRCMDVDKGQTGMAKTMTAAMMATLVEIVASVKWMMRIEEEESKRDKEEKNTEKWLGKELTVMGEDGNLVINVIIYLRRDDNM